MKRIGWKTMTVWECELERDHKAVSRVRRFLGSPCAPYATTASSTVEATPASRVKVNAPSR